MFMMCQQITVKSQCSFIARCLVVPKKTESSGQIKTISCISAALSLGVLSQSLLWETSAQKSQDCKKQSSAAAV